MKRFMWALAVISATALWAYFWITADKQQPDVSLNLTPMVPTATTHLTRTSEPQPTATGTPAPKFEATQQALQDLQTALERERAANLAAIETQRAEAANQSTATQAAHNLRMMDAEYVGQVEAVALELEQARGVATYEAELHAAVISRTLEINAREVQAAGLTADVLGWVRIMWWAGLAMLGFIAIMLGMAAIVKHYLEAGRKDATIEARQKELDAERMRLDAESAAEVKVSKLQRLHRFVVACIAVNGADDHQIPSNTKLQGWHANAWSDAVNDLKADGMVTTIQGGPNSGTFLKVGTLGDLLHALENNAYPYPTTVASRHGYGFHSRMPDEKQA